MNACGLTLFLSRFNIKNVANTDQHDIDHEITEILIMKILKWLQMLRHNFKIKTFFCPFLNMSNAQKLV